MIIRKTYDFENAHIVRDCSSKRCKTSIHGHSYKVEVLLESNFLDDGHMVYDFGLMKLGIGAIIDSFDHATTIYSGDNKDYIKNIKKYSKRWVQIPLNPSAEQFSRIFFALIDTLLKNTVFENNEKNVKLFSIIVHETSTGYAQCFLQDLENKNMGEINIKDIVFSDSIIDDMPANFYKNLYSGKKFKFSKDC